MRTFTDPSGQQWVATAHEEDTPRHHGRWYLVFHPAGQPERADPMYEVRWKTRATAERTIRTMSETELRRRLRTVLDRSGHQDRADGGPADGPGAGVGTDAGGRLAG